ncbi:MAG TPA: isochorismatase [Polynucleobacter sp.]|nr:isochorismatase [Polynucleobacter sp.]
MPSIYEEKKVLQQCIRIAKIATLLGVPIVGTEQSPQSLGNNAAEITPFCEQMISKEYFDGRQNGLVNVLSKNREHLIFAGCETHVYVMQTALERLRQNFRVSILVDAVGSRRPLDRDIALHRLASASAIFLTTEMLAFEWLGSAENPLFKEALGIIKS